MDKPSTGLLFVLKSNRVKKKKKKVEHTFKVADDPEFH